MTSLRLLLILLAGCLSSSPSRWARTSSCPTPAPTTSPCVTLEGEVKLRNFEKIPTDIVVVVQVPGKPTEASDNGVRSADPTKLQLLDRLGTVRWQLTIKPGESKTLKYKYERFVPSS